MTQPFPWSLDPASYQTTIFTKKKMVESVDFRKVCSFIKNEMGISYTGISRYNCVATTYKTELEQIKKYRDNYNRKLDKFHTSFALPKHKWGRVNPADYLSLSIFHRPTRHAFCDNTYIDLDMVNAQPTLIYNICRSNGINLQKLGEYVANPTEFRSFVMEHHQCSKDSAKQLFIRLMFGGSYETWLKDECISKNETKLIDDVLKIESELRQIMETVYSTNPHIKKDVLRQNPSKWRSIDEEKRGVMALWSQTLERTLQESAIMYLVESKHIPLETIVPCQDGFMILKQYNYKTICEDIYEHLLSKIGIAVPFIEKLFDEAIDVPMENDDTDASKSFTEWEDEISAKRMADRFISEFSDYVVKRGNNLYVYWSSEKDDNGKMINGRWFDETDDKRKYKLSLYISEDLYFKMSVLLNNASAVKDSERQSLLKMCRNQTSRGGNINDIIRHILPKVNQCENDFNNNPFLLGFNNGVYDLQTDEFRKYEFHDFITMTTGYDYISVDYNEVGNQALRDELNVLFETIHPVEEMRLLNLQVLASGLDGRAYQKLFLFNGQGGNGKGLEGSLMNKSLGDYYYQPSNGILKDIEKSNCPSPDIYNLKHKRYINFQELTGSIRVGMLRKLTGGGQFVGRLLHQNPEQFNLSATFVGEFNAPPDFDGKPEVADYRRIVPMTFPVNFTDNPDKIDKNIGGIQYKKANSYYETQEFLIKMRPIFLDLLLSIYRKHKDGLKGMSFTIPDSIRQAADDFLGKQNLFRRIFNISWIKITDNTKDDSKYVVKARELWESVSLESDYRDLKSREKRQYGRDEFYKWLDEQFTVKGNNKTGKLICGVARISDMPDKIDPCEEVYDSEGDETDRDSV